MTLSEDAVDELLFLGAMTVGAPLVGVLGWLAFCGQLIG